MLALELISKGRLWSDSWNDGWQSSSSCIMAPDDIHSNTSCPLWHRLTAQMGRVGSASNEGEDSDCPM